MITDYIIIKIQSSCYCNTKILMLLLLYVPQAYDIVRCQDMARYQFPSLPNGSLYFTKKIIFLSFSAGNLA